MRHLALVALVALLVTPAVPALVPTVMPRTDAVVLRLGGPTYAPVDTPARFFGDLALDARAAVLGAGAGHRVPYAGREVTIASDVDGVLGVVVTDEDGRFTLDHTFVEVGPRRVVAESDDGWRSRALQVRVARPPAAPAVTLAESARYDVLLASWTAADDDGGSPLRAWRIEVYDAHGALRSGTDLPSYHSRISIPVGEAREHTVRVRATSMVGPGGWGEASITMTSIAPLDELRLDRIAVMLCPSTCGVVVHPGDTYTLPHERGGYLDMLGFVAGHGARASRTLVGDVARGGTVFEGSHGSTATSGYDTTFRRDGNFSAWGGRTSLLAPEAGTCADVTMRFDATYPQTPAATREGTFRLCRAA